MAKEITIEGFKFTRNSNQDYSVLVEDDYGNSMIIEDLADEEGRSIRSNDGIELNDLTEVLTEENVQKIVRELKLQVTQARQEY